MGPDELAYRIRQYFITERERRGHYSDSYKSSSYVYREEQVKFYFSWSDRDRLQEVHAQLFPTELQTTLIAAEELLKHKISLFDRQFCLDNQIDWHRDPLTGNRWPERFWGDIDIRDGNSVGGVKWTWELNRHHHLITLGKAYFLSNDERFAEEVCSQLDAWVTKNPPGIGVNWTSSLELAIRLINWIWALAFVRQAPSLTETLFSKILMSIARQTSYIERHLSAYSSANNHLMGEAAGLTMVGMCFPGFPSAARWRQTGYSIMTAELEKQIYSDGVSAEQAPEYLEFILDFNLLVWRLAQLNDIEPPSIWFERFDVATNFLAHIMDNRAHYPHIGDGDNASVVRLDDRQSVNNAQSLLSSAIAVLNRPGFAPRAPRWDEKNQWILGDQGRVIFDEQALYSHRPESRAFSEGGYCVMRENARTIIFDCGPLGYLSTAAHGHADALSIMLSSNGVQWLTDPGTYAYQEGGAWREYLRGTSAHNTIVLDGENQSEIQGSFLWGAKAQCRLLLWHTEKQYDIAIAEHDGYTSKKAQHRRILLFYKPDWIIIFDDLIGNGEHQISQYWHFPANSIIDARDEFTRIREGEKSILLKAVNDSNLTPEVIKGAKDPLQGWVSEHYGQVSPAPMMIYSGQINFPATLTTVICLNSDKQTDLPKAWTSITKTAQTIRSKHPVKSTIAH